RGLEAAPHALRLVLRLDVGEQARMLGELFRTGQKDDQPGPLLPSRRRRSQGRARPVEFDRKAVLPAGHGQIDLREKRRVKQCAVESAVSVVNLVALAQGVEGVLLSRVQLAR